MAFIQVIELKTSKFEEIEKIDQQWHAATEGRRTLQRDIITRDRNDPTRHLILAFFDSYESAMENSALPETGEFAGKLDQFVDGPITFHDLEVIDERS